MALFDSISNVVKDQLKDKETPAKETPSKDSSATETPAKGEETKTEETKKQEIEGYTQDLKDIAAAVQKGDFKGIQKEVSELAGNKQFQADAKAYASKAFSKKEGGSSA
ncbi:BA75_03689T0 [Komagataella pastoris]|uniref:BA75_03689T0 n=1 Tax=Komagataella pastoris TaxID=4922 RepID=A0A1B2JGV1_PICPA|nr:BA75_03689T0 [Komagataella pastoris]